MKRLVLDLGKKGTGFAVGGREHMVSGCWSLKQGRYEGGGMVFVKFRQRLNEIDAAYGIEEVAFEEVRNHKGVDAAHIYGGLLAVLTEWCEERKIPYRGIPVQTIKKSWTGRGNANKDMMVAEAIKRGFNPIDDNEADAIALFDYCLNQDGEGARDAPMSLEEIAA